MSASQDTEQAEHQKEPSGATRPVTAGALLRSLDRVDSVTSAAIEISDRCNEVCVHCYQVQGQKGEMTTEQVKAAMDGLAAVGVLKLTLSGGEATLRHDFLELVAHARTRGFLVTIFTNGLTMTEELAASLGELGVFSVEISLYGIEAASHDFVTGVPGSFDRTVAGVRHLVANQVHVVVKATLMSTMEETAEEYRSFVEELGAAPMLGVGSMHAREDGDRAPEAFTRTAASYRREILADPAYNAPETEPRPRRQGSPCAAAMSLHVEPNGEVRPCSMLQVNLGNVTEGALGALDDNVRRSDMRGLDWQQLHGCRDCELSSYCGHCYASALEQTGDALGPYPTGCASARLDYEVRHRTRLTFAGPPSDLGPYRIEPDGRLRRVEDTVTEVDDQLAERLGWTRTSGFVAQSPPASARPGDLVQLRRPGRKTSKPHRLPGAVGGATQDKP